MNEFTRGVLFAAGMALFGKSLYELGKESERNRQRKIWKAVLEKLDKDIKILKKEEED